MVPSGSTDPPAFAVTASGAFPVTGFRVRAAVGFWFGRSTVMAELAELDEALSAVNATLYGAGRALPVAGVHVKVPEVLPGPAANTALFPAGRAERSAVKDAIASPSGSEAVTVNVSSTCSVPVTAAGAPTEGARSTLVTVIEVDAEPERALEAVNATV